MGQKQSIECVEKRRKAMTGKKYDDKRRKNIGKSRTTRLPAKKVAEMRLLLDVGMPDGYVREKCAISYRVYSRYKKELYPSGIAWQCKWLENDIEPCVVEEVCALSKQKVRYKRIGKMVGIGNKTVKLILRALSKKDASVAIHSYDDKCWSERKESNPEKLVRELLEQKGVAYQQEAQIEPGSKWLFDFRILNTNLLLEVQGDYWHCNPLLYPTPINNYQVWARKRDFAKRDYARRLGYTVMPIWEHDLKTSITTVQQNIERTIEKCKLEQ